MQNKKLQACKPDSVTIQKRTAFYHLSGFVIANKVKRPTPRHQASHF